MQSDVTIIGAGLTGLTLASTLARLGLQVTVISNQDPTQQLQNLRSQQSEDGRAYAIASGSVETLTQAGIWQHMGNHSSPILHIRVSDGNSHSKLDYDHSLINHAPMGYMVDALALQEASLDAALSHPNITIHTSPCITQISPSAHSVTLHAADLPPMDSSLLVVCDGRFSSTRELLGIDTLTHLYEQTALVCTIKHEHHHQHIAQERFLPTGPFAALPLKGGYHSSLVWVEDDSLASIYQSLPQGEVNEHIQERIGGYLGACELSSPIHHFPLTLKHATQYYAPRTVLLGDTAHGIHPLAGQGLNLGFRDIDVLSELIKTQLSIGADIGHPTLCRNYDKERKFDSWSLIAVTHGFDLLFASRNPFVKATRRMGLTIVDHLPTLKKQFMHHAMGK